MLLTQWRQLFGTLRSRSAVCACELQAWIATYCLKWEGRNKGKGKERQAYDLLGWHLSRGGIGVG